MGGRVSYLGGIVKDGLVLDLDAGKLDSYNRIGTTWNDVSGNRNNGTLTNFDSNKWSSDSGGALIFDGTDSYVNLSDVPFRITNYSFTSEFVFYFNGNLYFNKALLGKRSNSPNYHQWSFGINNGNPYAGGSGTTLLCFLRDDNNPDSPIFDRVLTYTLPNAGIYHVMLTNSQSQAQLWVNGILRSTSSVNMTSGNFNITGWNFRVGNTNSTSCWDEKIYLTRFYNKTLSNSEITQNYNSVKSRFNI